MCFSSSLLNTPLKAMSHTLLSWIASPSPFTGSHFLSICIYICAWAAPAWMDICASLSACFTLMCGISFKMDRIYIRAAPRGCWEVMFCCFLILLLGFFPGVPTSFRVLWVRFTSASRRPSHAGFSRFSIKAARVWGAAGTFHSQELLFLQAGVSTCCSLNLSEFLASFCF